MHTETALFNDDDAFTQFLEKEKQENLRAEVIKAAAIAGGAYANRRATSAVEEHRFGARI